MYFCFILNHDYEQMEEKVAADTGEIGMSIGQESMCVMSKDGYVNVETEMDDNISNQPGKKRKHDNVSEMSNESDNDAEVSTPQKKVCTSSSSTAPVEHDHTYCIGSPRRLWRKLDDVIDHAQRANKRLKKSRMKASRSTRLHVMESRPAFDSSVIIEDYFASSLPKKNTLIASTPLKIANLIRLGNEFAWEGSLESLKEFIKDKLNIEGKWSSPGGETKLFTSANCLMKWYGKSRKKLVVVKDDKNLMEKLSKFAIAIEDKRRVTTSMAERNVIWLSIKSLKICQQTTDKILS